VKTSRGFTLAELLVVVAIIAIFAAILFPVLYQAQDTAKMRVCASNLRQLGQAFRMYLDDWNGYTPSSQSVSSENLTFRPEPLFNYIRQPAVSLQDSNPKRAWICPGDRGHDNIPPAWKTGFVTTSSYIYPYRAYLACDDPRFPDTDVKKGLMVGKTPRRVEQWARPSRDLLLSDNAPNFHRGQRSVDSDEAVKCVNCLMLDGRVVSATYRDMWDGYYTYAACCDNPYSDQYNPGYTTH
jgi:prepilin-type N-terminal cleavage/methylation domain-containing protein